MLTLFSKSFFINESLQKYIDESIKKSIQRKIDFPKKLFLYVKNPIICELNYLKCDYDWSKQELFKYCNFTKNYLIKKNLKNKVIIPFCLYFFTTGSFFLLEQYSL